MFSFHNLFKLNVDVNDESLYLVWACPKCRDIGKFHLIVSEAKFNIIGVAVGQPHQMLDLRCCACGYEVKVASSEKPQLERARNVTLQFINGEINAEAYHATICNIGSQFVKDIRALTENWKCSQCGEENPQSFTDCWNCQSQLPVESPPSDAKPFPGLRPGGNPWEM